MVKMARNTKCKTIVWDFRFRIGLICVSILFGCYFIISSTKHDYSNEYDMTEWRVYLTQHLYGGSSNLNPGHRANHSCTLRQVKLSEQPLPVIGLASFPGSGNTWTRHLVQQMTGLATLSEYCDKRLEPDGFPFECSTDRTHVVVVKTHESKYFNPYQKLVLLIRSPFDAFLSTTHIYSVGHTQLTDVATLKEQSRKKFDAMVQGYISLLGNTIEQFRGPVYILQYERLKLNMADELRGLSTFLNVKVSQDDIECTVTLQEGNFHRKKTDTEHLKLMKSVFTEKQLLTMREVARFSEKMIQRAYGLYLNLGGPTEHILFNSGYQMHVTN